MTFIQTLNDYKERGLLTNQSHPNLPLLIWNYSVKVQYEQLWDFVTLQCRALVTDLEGNIISKGFSKFFNIEEERHEATDDFEVFCKEDGQYIGVFWFNGEMVVNSKGSFTSPYAIEAKRILEEKYLQFIHQTKRTSEIFSKISYCFELVGFEQIVVSYPESDLILTGCFQFIDKNLNWADISIFGFGNSIQIVKKYSGLDWKNIKHLNWQNSEGFVVRFSNGQRCKIKFEDYLKLHRQMTNLSTTVIWEALLEGNPVSSILNDVPDEFYQKVHQYENELKIAYGLVEKQMKVDFLNIEIELYNKEFSTKKDFAMLARTKFNSSLLFALYDGKDYSKIIWKLIKPKFEKI